MPELPETEVTKRDLEKEVVGRRIKDVEVRPGSNAMKVIKRHGRRKEFQDLLVGARVDRVDRIGRNLLLELDNEQVLVVNLGRTGCLTKTSASGELAAHTHVVIGFTIGGQLRMVDPKMSGEIYVAPKSEIHSDGKFRSFLIDPLDNQPIPWQEFSSQIEGRSGAIKALLLDEAFICGLGDIYSDEVLFSSGLRFDRSSDTLSSQDVRRLYRSLVETLQDAVRARGTTYGEGRWTDLQGNPGMFQLEFKVFEREGEPCRRCRSAIVRERYGNRSTYLCPQCQS
jgi:formamidopyrimidine-DNA glycosylase